MKKLLVNMFLTYLPPYSYLHPNISMLILQAVLHKFPKVLTRRIC